MVEVCLVSSDRTLYSLLSSALGKEFSVSYSAGLDDSELGSEVISNAVLLIDLDSNQPDVAQRLIACRTLMQQEVTAVLLADDLLRAAASELVRLGAFGYCRRPPSLRELKALLQRAYEHATLKKELRAAQARLRVTAGCDQLIGSSTQMLQVYDMVKRVASIGASVLITGESGTGKELIARAIHNTGVRTGRPFVAVSCGAIPETLIESELFGHEKGAFTGTAGARVGLMEQAGDGTLFLDEIGELSLATQVKLLRVLQQREFTRLGSNRPLPLKARLVFATHQNLGDMVAQGRFRQDLYYRIHVVRIDAPALQDHPEDIEPLAQHFLAHYSQSYDKPMREIHPEALHALQGYAWPGNVRELENVIQRGIVLAHDETLRLGDLPANLHEVNLVSMDEYQAGGSFERQLRAYKIKLAVTAVRECGGNKTEAARVLQISRAYLHRLLRLADSETASEAPDILVLGPQEIATV